MQGQQEQSKPKIGLIGVGVMGKCILEQLRKHNYQLTVYDPVPEALDYAAAAGATPAADLAELARSSDIILLSLPGPAQIRDVVLGQSGLKPNLQSSQVVIDTSTVDPASTRLVADELAKDGIAYLDAPILGRPSALGRWVMPVGGPSDAVEAVRPLLEALAASVIHVGPSGAANTLKLLNQLMFTAINGITAEVMAIADKTGVEPGAFYDVVANSGAATVSGLFREVGRNIVEGEYLSPTFTVDLMIKDVGLALEMARSVKAPSLIAQTVQNFNLVASANGMGRQDTSALFKVFQKIYDEEMIDET